LAEIGLAKFKYRTLTNNGQSPFIKLKEVIEMRKKTFLILIGLMVGACAPNLVSYPPTAINPATIEGWRELRLSSQAPSEEYGSAMKTVVEQFRGTISIYQKKLFPVFNQMHQKYQKKDYSGTNILIAKARAYNAEWVNSYSALKSAYEKLSEANNNLNNSAIKAKTDQFVDFGKELVDRVLNFQSKLRELLDMTEGYDKARVERNLSYLTKENEQKFNNLSQNLYQSGEDFNKKLEVLFQLLVELNELLNKGGG